VFSVRAFSGQIEDSNLIVVDTSRSAGTRLVKQTLAAIL
jgi:hypothetical protein